MDARQFAGDFLSADDLKRDVTAKVSGCTSKQFQDGDKLVLHFDGPLSPLPLNKVNTQAMIAAFGPDTLEWSGVQVQLCKEKTKFGKKVVDCIRIKANQSAADSREEKDLPF